MSSTRDLKFDGLKALLIFLVVLGHIDFYDYGIHLKRYIYSFHMPLFVFLSGYFTSFNYDRKKQNNWIKKSFIIYILAQVTQVLLFLIIGYTANTIKGAHFNALPFLNWKQLLLFPKTALWYILCLIYWRFAYWRLCDRIKDTSLFVISVLLLIIAGFIPLGYHFSFQRAFAFLPFFVSGIVFKKHNLLPRLERLPLLLALFALLIGLFATNYLPTYLPVNHFETWRHLLQRLMQTGLGLYLSLLIIRLSRSLPIERFAKYGSKTLWIYIGHVYLIMIGRKVFHVLGIQLNLLYAIPLAVLYCVLILYVAFIFDSYHNKHKETHST